jgi:hypothetical protein
MAESFSPKNEGKDDFGKGIFASIAAISHSNRQRKFEIESV